MSGIHRLPYRIGVMLNTRKGFRMCIFALGAIDEDDAPPGMPISMAAFIYMHCHCAYCGAGIHQNLRRCACDQPRGSSIHLDAMCSHEIQRTVFKPIYERYRARMKAILAEPI